MPGFPCFSSALSVSDVSADMSMTGRNLEREVGDLEERLRGREALAAGLVVDQAGPPDRYCMPAGLPFPPSSVAE